MRSNSTISLVGALAALGAIGWSPGRPRSPDLSVRVEFVRPVTASLTPAQTSGTPDPEKKNTDPPGLEQPESPPPAVDDAATAASIEQPAIEAVINRYRTAFNSLDAAAVAGVWPGVDVHILSNAFDNLAEQQFDFRKCTVWLTREVGLTGVMFAVASCAGTARFVPKAGTKTPRLEPRTWTFKLSKGDRGWLIYNVETRDGVSAERLRTPLD